MREAGLEPATSRLSAGCSNRLSHPRKGSLGDLTFRHKHDGWRNDCAVKEHHSSSMLLIVMYDGNCITFSKVRERTTSSRRSRVRAPVR